MGPKIDFFRGREFKFLLGKICVAHSVDPLVHSAFMLRFVGCSWVSARKPEAVQQISAMCFAHVSPVRHALTSSGLSVVNAPFRECVAFPLLDPNVSVRRIEASFRKRGNSLFGKPWSGVPRPRLWFCVLVSIVRRFCLFFCWLFCCSRFHFSCRFSSLSYFYWYFSFPVQGVVCVYTATMGRMFWPGKGMSSTTLPYKRRAPSWIKLKPEDLSEQFYKLTKKGITPSSIGVTLCSFGVAQLEMFTSIKFLRILKKKGLAPFIPEDLYFLVEKDVSTQLSIEEPVEPDCMKYGVSSTKAVFRPHVRKLVWSWLDTESRLRIVAIGRDSLLQAGLDFGTSETMYMLSILQSVEVDLQNYESVSWYLPVPSSVSSTSGSSVSSWTPWPVCQQGGWQIV